MYRGTTRAVIGMVIITVALFMLHYHMNSSYYHTSSCHGTTTTTTVTHIDTDTTTVTYGGDTSSTMARDRMLSGVDQGHSRTLISYAYYETDAARENAAYFFLVGLMPYMNHSSVDILIVLMSDISVELPKGTNVFTHKRLNWGLDICAWQETMPLVMSITGRPVDSYRYFIWMNASVRGPILPAATPLYAWLPYFLSQINEHTKLIGTTVNCMVPDVDRYGGGPPYRYGQAHLQSMFLAFDWHIFDILFTNCRCFEHKDDSVFKGEIMLTRGVLQAGYGIQSQMLAFRGVNWTNAAEADAACDYDHEQNPMIDSDRIYPDCYYGTSVQPLEVIFFKSGRRILPIALARYTEWNRRVAQRMYPYYQPYGYGPALVDTSSPLAHDAL